MKSYIQFIKNFFKENQIFFYTSFFLFVFFIIISFFIPIDESTKHIILDSLKQKVLSVYAQNNWILFKNIFLNNLLVSFIILVSWFFLSLFWVLILFSNVFSVLLLSSVVLQKTTISKLLLSLLPHGIFEISAILLTLGLALKISWVLIKKVWNWKDNIVVPHLKNIFKFWLFFIVPLLLFAAFVEAFITRWFI